MYCVGFFLMVCVPISDIYLAPVARMYWGGTILLHARARSKLPRLALPSWLQQFGIVFLKHCLHHSWSALFRRVYFLNQLVDPRGHHKKITEKPRPRIPVGVWSSARHQYRRPRLRFHTFIVNSYAKGALKRIPRLIIIVVKMERSNKPRRPWWTTGVLPFRNHKAVFAGSECASR